MTRIAHLLHDDGPSLDLAEAVLEAQGFRVHRATDAYRLLGLPAEPAADLALVGITAVDERDVDVVALLRERYPNAFIVLAYPASLRERAAEALAQGADAYLPEPFYPGELISLARRAAGRAEGSPPRLPEAPPAAAGNGAGAGTGTTDGLELLAGGVSHLVAQPLQILNLMIGSVEAGEPLNVEDARKQMDRVAAVARDLSRFSEMSRARPHRHSVDLNEVLEGVFGPKGPFMLELAPDRPRVLAQAESLRAAFGILRARAEHVTPPGATISVHCRVLQESAGETVEVVVADRGPPVSASRLGRLFDPDPDQSALQEGTWLDLPAVAGIIRHLDGDVSASAMERGGTAIRVQLPVITQGAGL